MATCRWYVNREICNVLLQVVDLDGLVTVESLPPASADSILCLLLCGHQAIDQNVQLFFGDAAVDSQWSRGPLHTLTPSGEV